MSLLSANLEVLKKRFPVTYQLVASADDTSNRMLQNSCIEFNNTKRSLYGLEAPEKLITRWASSQVEEMSQCYGVGGFGDGRHIEHLLKNTDENSVLFVAEDDPAWLKHVFSRVDCSGILQDERMALVTGEQNEDFFETLAGFPLLNIPSCKALPYTPLARYNPSYYETFFNKFNEYFYYLKNLHTVNIRDGWLWQASTLTNLPKLIDAPDIARTKGLFEGLPVILIAAGPSLDDAVDFLKSVQDKAVLVAVNSAYRKLYNSGIKPHMTIAADPRVSTFKGYEGAETDDVFLAAPHFVHPYVVNAFQGRTFTWNNSNKLAHYINKRLGQPRSTPILEKGTIAACIVDLAKIWGVSRICLVGQDLAVGADGQSHTKDSFYADESRVHLKLKDCVYMPGNVLEEVPVHRRLIDFLKTFTELVQITPEIEFINTSAIGAKIAGAAYMDYDKAASWVGSEDSSSVREQLAGCFQEAKSQDAQNARIVHALGPLHAFVSKLFCTCVEANLVIDMMPEKFREETYANNPKIKDAFAYSDIINRWIDSHPEEYDVLYDGPGKKELFDYVENVKKIEGNVLHWKELQKNSAYFLALAEAANMVMRYLKPCIRNAGAKEAAIA